MNEGNDVKENAGGLKIHERRYVSNRATDLGRENGS